MSMFPCSDRKFYSRLLVSPALRVATLISLFPSLTLWTVPVRANPTGGIVVHGNVDIGNGAGGNLLINQSSQNAIIDWSNFSIDAGELTQFIQPGTDSAVLNRVTSGDPSAIHGALRANGNVFLINPNGILVGAGGTIDVHGLVLSTLDVSNGEFLAGGDQIFKGSNPEGVTNLGRINAIGGDVFLIGKTVTNSGSITANSGTVGLAAGEEVLVTTRGGLNGERMFVRAGGSGVSGTGVLNDGTIQGAAVELKAHGNAYALAINNKGAIRATGTSTSGGRVFLHGVGGTVSNSGSIRATSSGIGSGGQALIAAAYARVDGTIEASGHSGGAVKIKASEAVELNGSINVKGIEGKGGDVVVEGIDLTLGSATDIDASGLTGGGSVQIGGGFQGRNTEIDNADILLVESGARISADAVESGNGGVVILWSDGDTLFSGDISARALGAAGNGGFAEISGKENLGFDGVADVTAVNGVSGTILLDPTNVTISSQMASDSIVNNIALSNLLDLGNNVVITSNFGAAGPAGNITVGRTNNQTTANGDRVEWYQQSAGTTPGTLSLLAVGDITFNTSVRSAGSGGINVVAGWDGFTGIVDPFTAAQNVTNGFDMAAVLATMPGGMNEMATDAAGLNGGSVFINSNSGQTSVVVGSRFGATNVAAHDLILKGSNLAAERFAQLGFNDTGVEYQIGLVNNGLRNEWWGSDAAADGTGFSESGNIQNKNYIALLGGTRAAGGSFDGAGSGANGDITARVSGKVDMRTGDDDRSFVQIGHGGNTQNGMEQERTAASPTRETRDGYMIDSGDTGRMFFSSSWRTNIEANPFNASDVTNARDYSVKGNIAVHAGEDVLVMAADDFETDPLLAALNAANNDASTGMTAQIGHGGLENHGSFHGNISVTANGVNDSPDAARPAGIGIDVIGGRGTSRFAQIGNGSSAEGNRQSILDQTRSGDITVSAATGAIRLQGYNEPVDGAESAWFYSQVQIGHGGAYQSAPASALGFFTLPGNIPVEGVPDNSASGTINVFAGGTYQDARYAEPLDPTSKIGISAQGGTGQYDYAQIGHGGANLRAATNAGFQGNIDVQAAQGDIVFAGGQDARVASDSGYGRNHALIGHGGRDVDGVKGGTITVLAGQGDNATDGDILFTAGKHLESFAQIGHGGVLSGGGVDSLLNAADLVVTAQGDIRFESGQSGETNALETSVGYANYWFNYVSGTERNGYWLANDRYVMIGHGGYEADGSMLNRQDISVTSGTGDLANADGNLLTGGITFISGDQDRNFAQIGHGGHNNGANDADGFAGNINIRSNGGGVVFDGSIEGGTRYQRTSNGISLDGSTDAARTVTAREAGLESYIQIGHGGYAARGDHSGTISIVSQGGVDLIGSVNNPTNEFSFSAATDNLSALSNGVQSLNSQNDVWISLSPIKDTAATAGTAFGVSIGAVNVKAGSLRIVLSDDTVITDLPDADNDGRQSRIIDQLGNEIGDINYEQGIVKFNTAMIGSGAASVVSVDYTSINGYKERAYAQIGHGGYEADGPNNNANNEAGNSGLIEIFAGDDIRLHAGSFYRNSAQIGHGGHSNKGAHSGDIVIGITPGTAGGKLEVLAGTGGHRHYDYEAYGMVGHGGYDADGNHFGDISITTGKNATDGLGVFFKAGDSKDNFVQLGHGGANSNSGAGNGADSFGLNGDINVTTSGDISFVAGTMTKNNPLYDEDGRLYAMVGHGGYNSDASVNDTNNYGQNDGVAFTRASVGDTNAGEAGVGDGKWGHFGDITLTSSSGNINVMAGSTRAVADRLDSDGNALPLPSDPLGLLVSNGNGGGIVHFAQIGHGGYATGGDHHGNVVVTASNGSVNLVGGDNTDDTNLSKYNYAMVGHGGGNDQGHMGRSDEMIVVNAFGADSNVVLAGGTGRFNHAMIGHGGYNVDGTHISNIQVYAGNDVILQGGLALARVVSRSGEYQDISGTDGGHANDLSEFNGYYGADGLGYLLLDQAAAAGGNQKTKLIGDNIQPNTVQFRFAVVDGGGQNAFDSSANPDFVDDGNGNIVAFGDTTPVGSINYSTGEIVWFSAILGTDTPDQPDVFVSYDHKTQIVNDSFRSYAQIGHGGYSSSSVAGDHAEGLAVNVGHTGDIDVRAGVDAAGEFNSGGGSLIARAGNDARTYVHIGHGGDDSIAAVEHAYRGNIITMADGDILFRGGGGLVDNQNIAFNFGGDGNVESVTEGRSNVGISDVLYAYAQIGHGGYNSDANNSLDTAPLALPEDTTGHNGSILAKTGTGNINFSGGGVTGFGHYAQIGHGGHNSDGNHFGEITVDSGADITFTGGGSSYRSSTTEKRSYAQIGHGGHAMTGNLLGTIDVDSVGSISFSGGNVDSNFDGVPYGAHVYVMNLAGNQDDNHSNRTEARQNVAQIGHGGTFVYGDKSGDIFVDAGSDISFNGGLRLDERDDSANTNFAMIGHGGFFAWRQYIDNIQPAGAINSDNYNLFSNLDGTGQVFWPLTAAGEYLPDGFEGNIAVTSANGDITFTAGNAQRTFAMVGHGGINAGGDHKGDISVNALAGNVTFNADVDNHGTNVGVNGNGNNTFVMIGHGGTWSDGEIGAGMANGISYTTDIHVSAGNAITFHAGEASSFGMIGHGGYSNHSTSVVTSTTPDYRFAGDSNYGYRPGTRSGNIMVDAIGDINFTGGSDEGDNGFVMIGNGGYHIAANPDANSAFGDGHSGDIDVVSSNGAITFKAGERLADFAQIGHGGYESYGNHGGDGMDNRLDSDILVQASGDITFLGGSRSNSTTARAYAMIGHGGWKASFRDIEDVDAAHYAILQPYNTFGTNVDNAGRHPWAPFTTNPDGLAMTVGTGDLIGVPGVYGAGAATLGTFMGDITVRTTATGDIVFRAPNDADGTYSRNAGESHVQIGHGGYRNFADIEGEILVESAGGIEFSAVQGEGDANVANNQGAYALLGHGGYEVGGEFSGTITVSSTDSILFRGGNSTDGANGSFAQLGHGGYNADDDQAEYTNAAKDASGTIKELDNDTGHSGKITVTVTDGDLQFLAGRDAQTYVQLGHGGYSTRDSHSGEIIVNVSGGISFIASADIDDDTVNANPGNNDQAYAQLGHGGYDADGSHFGNITVTAGSFASGAEAGKGIVFRSGNWEDSYSQLGHGGTNSNTFGDIAAGGPEGLFGHITVQSEGEILFVAGTLHKDDGEITNNDGRLYTQLGHGGYNADNTLAGSVTIGLGNGHNGNISVVSTNGSISFLAGDAGRDIEPSVGTAGGRFNFAQLGHGGYASSGDHHGNITVRAGINADGTVNNAEADVWFNGGGTPEDDFGGINFAFLGHGGRSSQGNLGRDDETISVMAGRDILFQAGNGNEGFAQLGNGGRASLGDKAGNIQLFAERNITFAASSFAESPGLGNGRSSTYGYTATSANEIDENLDRAGNFEADSNGVGGDVAEGVANLHFQRIIPGSVRIEIRDDSGNLIGVLVDDIATGNLVAEGDFAFDFNGDTTIDPGSSETITIGQVLGSMNNYYTGQLAFSQDINPGASAGVANIILTVQHSDVDLAYAQLGHGGYDSETGGAGTINASGNISAIARTGNMSFTAGSDTGTYVQVGHGGYQTEGSNSGDISLRAAGNISLVGGDGGAVDEAKTNYAQIGHGGWGADTSVALGHNGAIKVSSGSGALFTSLGTGTFNDGFDFDLDGITDAITFGADVSTTGVLVQGGTGQVVGGVRVINDDNSAQIGHGGRSAGGNHQGDIAVSATSNISVLGGSGYRSYAQIGHGGLAASGNLSGGVSVISENGDVIVKAGSPDAGDPDVFESYALIGHGDDRNANTNNATGSRGGEVFVLANTITMDRSGAELAWIGHNFDMAANVLDPFATQSFNAAATNLGGGMQIIGRNGVNILDDGVIQNGNVITLNDSFRDRYITPNLQNGAFTYSGTDLTIDAQLDTSVGSAFANAAAQANTLSFIAVNDLVTNANIGNSGTGALNLIAGGTVNNQSTIQYAGDVNILAGDDVLVNSAIQSSGAGNTNLLAGGNVLANASIRHSGTGNVNLLAVGDILANANIQHSGTGNLNLVAGSNIPGYSIVDRPSLGVLSFQQIDHLFCPPVGILQFGAIALPASCLDYGMGNGSVMIGSGTQTTGVSVGSRVGSTNISAYELDVRGSDTTSNGYAQLGYYGDGSGPISGDLNISTHGTGLEVTAGSASGAFAQIGHGGAGSVAANVTGDINISFCEMSDITLTGGGGSAYSQLGHGGLNVDANFGGNLNFDSNIGVLTIKGGNGADAYAQLGFGGAQSGRSKTGDLTIAAESVLIEGGMGTNTSARLGHGGNSGSGSITGDIFLTSNSGAITLAGGNGGNSTAQIGMGGTSYSNSNSMSNNINVISATGVSLTSGNGNGSRTIIGHGGQGSSGVYNGNVAVTANNGDIEVRATGDGDTASAQIGHNSRSNAGATLGGEVLVNASNNVAVEGGSSSFSYAQIGHGSAGANGAFSGDIKVNSGNNALLLAQPGVDGAYAKIGHGDDLSPALAAFFAGAGTRSGDIQFGAENQISVLGGMVGHVNQATVSSGQASATSGNTYIAPSRSNPANGSGVLLASADSEFSSAPDGELRFYFPGKPNNRIAAGTLLNGTPYIGTSANPSSQIRADEFVNVVTGFNAGTPSQHQNLTPFYENNLIAGAAITSDSPGVYSQALGNYSLYYNQVSLVENPAGASGGNGFDNFNFETAEEFIDYITMGLLEEDGFDNRKRRYGRRAHPFFVSYRGFSLYGADGEVSFQFGIQTTDVAEPFVSFNSEVAIDLPPVSIPPQASVVQP